MTGRRSVAAYGSGENGSLKHNALDQSDGLKPNAVESSEGDRSETPKLGRRPKEDIPLVERIRDIQRRTSKTMALVAK